MSSRSAGRPAVAVRMPVKNLLAFRNHDCKEILRFAQNDILREVMDESGFTLFQTVYSVYCPRCRESHPVLESIRNTVCGPVAQYSNSKLILPLKGNQRESGK
jgi:hypothetical protein